VFRPDYVIIAVDLSCDVTNQSIHRNNLCGHVLTVCFDLTAVDDEEESEEEDAPDTLIQYQGYTFRTPGGAALDQQVVNHNLQVS